MASVNSQDLIYKYEAFGLKIHSAVSLPELTLSNSEIPDVIIYLGEVNLPIESVLNEGLTYKVTDNALYRFWEDIGKFKITKNSIIIDSINSLNKIILTRFILGTVFATLLRLRGLFVLHASSVNINGFTVAFSGFKGYGKSTTAMAFYNEGYSIIADDYVSIEFDNTDIPIISPGFPSLSLSSKSREAMGLNFDKTNLKTIIDKIYVSVPKSFSSFKILLNKIYILQRGKNFKIINLKPQEAFIELIKNTFGIQMFSKLELPDNFFQCEKIVKKVDMSILEVPNSLNDIKKVVKIVEEDIGDEL